MPLTKSANFHDLFEKPKIYLTFKGLNEVSLTNSPEFLNIIDYLEVYTHKPLTKSTNFHDLFEKPKIYLTLRGVNDVSLTNSPEFFTILSI